MRMDQDLYQRMEHAIAAHDTLTNRARYLSGDFPRADRVKDLNMRYRWDLLHMANGAQFTREAYAYGLSDSHIDTALRHIVAPLTKEVQS